MTTKTFAELGVEQSLVDALAEQDITHPFPIQELTLPMALQGADVIGQARTGTGKTLAFGLALLGRVDPDKDHVQALVIAPTRELCLQVTSDLEIGKARGLHVTSVYGGVPIDPQIKELKNKAQIVVGTPGRLLDHLGRGTLDLSNVTELVLDEADEMLDMGFLPDVERLIEACSTEGRHTMLYSATVPAAIVSLARRYMDHPTFMRAESDEPETAPTVEQHFFMVHRMDKPRLLARILQTPDRGGVYVFTRTKNMADRLVDELDKLGVDAIAIHGDLRQATREKNMDKFRDGKADVLVATEVAARGLDVENVTHVINYDCPNDDKMYLHRIGRTARAGAKGVAITFAEFNEVDRLNVIRKAVGAGEGGEIEEVFSTSDEITEIFDLPDETPWDHLTKNGGSSSSRSSSRGSSSKRTSSKRTSKGSSNGRSKDTNRSTDSSGSGGSGRSGRKSSSSSGRSGNDSGGGSSRTSSRSRTRTRTRTRSTSGNGSDRKGSSNDKQPATASADASGSASGSSSGKSSSSTSSDSGQRTRARRRARSSSSRSSSGGSSSGTSGGSNQEQSGSKQPARSDASSRNDGVGRGGRKTASDRATRRGEDARGHGRPMHSRRVKVDYIP